MTPATECGCRVVTRHRTAQGGVFPRDTVAHCPRHSPARVAELEEDSAALSRCIESRKGLERRVAELEALVEAAWRDAYRVGRLDGSGRTDYPRTEEDRWRDFSDAKAALKALRGGEGE